MGLNSIALPGALDVDAVKPGRLNALDPGFHCARTHWIRGFMAFQLARRSETMQM